MIAVLEQERPNLIIVDALTSNPLSFAERLRKGLSFKCKIISENRADDKYMVVGAASIVAKELREQEVAQIKLNVGKFGDIGSGYPSDPKTKLFIKKYWDNKEVDFIFRKSWATYKNLASENKVKQDKTLRDFY